MKPPPLRYARPEVLDEVVALLAQHGEDARLLAGGQSLLPRLSMRLDRPKVLVDVSLVPELTTLAHEGDTVVIGAATRQRTAETSALVRVACPLLPLALDQAGPPQIRTRGTVGGSLAHADPAAELPAVAVALDAELVAHGPQGRRTVPAREFFRGAHETALARDEVLVEARLPALVDTRCAFLEATVRARSAAIAGVAAAVRMGEAGGVEDARLAAFGVGDVPVRLTSAEQVARGSPLEPADRARIAEAAAEDVHEAAGAGAPHRRRMAAALVARALEQVAA